MKKLFLLLFLTPLLLVGCVNYQILPNGETVSKEDFCSENLPHFVYLETEEEVLKKCDNMSNVACYKPSTETVYIRKGLRDKREVFIHEWAHHVIMLKYPENIRLPVATQERLVHQLLGII